MRMRVHQVGGGYRIEGDWDGLEPANAFLSHLGGRGFSPATVRAYAFDVVNLARFLAERDLTLAVVDAPLVFDWIDWQGVRRSSASVNAERSRSAAASTVNRRVAAVRALFEYLVMTGRRGDNPVPSPRRGQGLRRSEGACWATWVRVVLAAAAGWCASHDCFRSRCRPMTSRRSWPR